MADNKFMKELESAFCRMLDENLLSFDVKRPNGFVDVVCITSILTQKTKVVYFDFFGKEVSFWNDFDENFVCPFTEQGISDLFSIFRKEIEQACFFSIIDKEQEVLSIAVKLTEATNPFILENIIEFHPYINVKFDKILFTDFLGKICKTIQYDANLSKFTIAE